MPIARFQLPDGRIARFEVPDGTTPEQAQQFISQQDFGGTAPRPKREPVDVEAAGQDAVRKQAQEMGGGDAIAMGAGNMFSRVNRGLEQAYRTVIGDEEGLANLKQRSEREEKLYKPFVEERPVLTAVGASLPAAVVPAAAPAASVGGTMARLGAAGAAPQALSYGTAGERAENAAIGAVGNVVGGAVVPKALELGVNAGKTALKGLAGKITPEAMALYERAKQLGIPVNLAQLGDSKFLKTLASTVEQVPLTGAAKKVDAQRSAYNQAVARTFGEDADRITPEVYAAAKKRIGGEFNNLSGRNNLTVTPQFRQNVDQILKEAEATGSDDTVRAVRNISDRLSNQTAQGSPILGPNGQPVSAPTMVIPGKTYQSIDTELSNIIKGGGEKGFFAKRLRNEIQGAFDQSISAADQGAWQEARSQYKNLKAVRDIVAKDADNGNIPPTRLMSALNNSEAGKEAMAMGTRGQLGELGQIGRQFVRDPIANSGTVPRAVSMGVLGGSAWTAPMSTAAVAATTVGTGRLVTKLINSPRVIQAVTSRGVSARDLMNMPPSQALQIIGGATGMTAAQLQQLDEEQ